jgi:hypothetical protein
MPQYTRGKAVWYAPGLMDSTAIMRGMNLEGFKGGVATNSVAMMGKVVWLKRDRKSWEGPFLVVDVSQRNHAWHHAVNVKTIVEVDFKTAAEWGIVFYKKDTKKGYVVNKWSENGVEMWVGLEPPREIKESPIIYETWYKENAEFCDGESNRRWKLENWMIRNYGQYRVKLSTTYLPPSNIPETDITASIIPDKKHLHAFFQRPTFKIITTQEKAEKRKFALVTASPPTKTFSSQPPKIMKIHTLKGHETWTHLSLRYYGYTTEPYWRLIYEANKDMVGDDYRRIWGGMEIKIPELPADFTP